MLLIIDTTETKGEESCVWVRHCVCAVVSRIINFFYQGSYKQVITSCSLLTVAESLSTP